MAPHDHLLDNFLASKETRDLGHSFLRQAHLKTGPGSGHELGLLKVALPAVCMLLASERLNNTDVSRNASQVASCVKKKDYEKVYTLVKVLLEETEEERLSYHQLHTKYKSDAFEERMKPFIARVENELIVSTDLDHKMDIFKATVYFWVCSSARVKTLPETPTFSREHHLPAKKFILALQHLNETCQPLRKAIYAHFKLRPPSPVKVSENPSTPRQSPRKVSNVATSSRTTTEEPEPVRRSLRNAVAQDSTSKTSPVKRTPQTSPTKIITSTPFRGFAQAKSLRELPTRDSPKKRVIESEHERKKDDGDEIDMDSTAIESPAKKRKVDVPVKPTSRSPSLASRPEIRQSNVELDILPSPSKANHKASNISKFSFPRLSTRGKALQATSPDSESSSDESEPEFNLSIRRHRPVYLDHKQWNARDPRLDRIWRKADKKRKAQAGSRPVEDGDVAMSE